MRSHAMRYPIPARTYHYDFAAGSDTATGAADKPRKTAGAASALAVRPGDRVLFNRGGTSDNYLQPGGSGRSGRPVVYADYGTGALPIIHVNATAFDISSTARHDIRVENLNFDNSAHAGNASMYVDKVNRLHLRGCTFKPPPSAGAFILNGDGHIIENCTFVGTGGAGQSNITVADATNVIMRGCLSTDAGADADTDQGFYISGCNGVLIQDCIAHNNAAHGFQLCEGDLNVVVERCLSYLNGGHGFETYTLAAGSNNTIRNCVMYSNVQSGINFSPDTNGIQLVNNTIVNNGTSTAMDEIRVYAGAAGNVFKNNVVVHDANVVAGGCWPIGVESDAEIAANTWDYNLYIMVGGSGEACSINGTGLSWAAWQAKAGSPDAHSVNDSPHFVTDYTNLHLGATSHAIGVGEVLPNVLTDYDNVVRGAAVDIGAYEYVA